MTDRAADKTFVQYGAGNIGRGFVGALFAGAGYAVKFIDVDDRLIAAMNLKKEYTIGTVDGKGAEYETIRGVSCVDGRDHTAASDAIAGASVMATAVGVNVLPRVAPVIAAGIKKKLEAGRGRFFNIIICENLIGADKLLGEKICEYLNDDERLYFEKYVGLAEASVGRMVPVLPPDIRARDPLFVRAEPYRELPVDADAFRGGPPEVGGLKLVSPFEFYIRRKLFIHNMGHAAAAYLGFLKGFEHIWQAVGDDGVCGAVERAMSESARALAVKYGVPLNEILDHVSDLINRFGNRSLGDTVSRVGFDSFRKTGADDRLAGAIRFCAGAGVDPANICAGLAAAMFFDNEDDAGTARLREMLARDGLGSVLAGHCGLGKNEPAFERVAGLVEKIKSGRRTGGSV